MSPLLLNRRWVSGGKKESGSVHEWKTHTHTHTFSMCMWLLSLTVRWWQCQCDSVVHPQKLHSRVMTWVWWRRQFLFTRHTRCFLQSRPSSFQCILRCTRLSPSVRYLHLGPTQSGWMKHPLHLSAETAASARSSGSPISELLVHLAFLSHITELATLCCYCSTSISLSLRVKPRREDRWVRFVSVSDSPDITWVGEKYKHICWRLLGFRV